MAKRIELSSEPHAARCIAESYSNTRPLRYPAPRRPGSRSKCVSGYGTSMLRARKPRKSRDNFATARRDEFESNIRKLSGGPVRTRNSVMRPRKLLKHHLSQGILITLPTPPSLVPEHATLSRRSQTLTGRRQPLGFGFPVLPALVPKFCVACVSRLLNSQLQTAGHPSNSSSCAIYQEAVQEIIVFTRRRHHI